MSDDLWVTPSNTQLERAVIGTLLAHPDRLVDVKDRLQVDDFLFNDHAAIFKEILEGRTSPFTIRVEGLEKSEVMEMMEGIPPSFNLRSAADELVDLSDRRRIMQTCQAAQISLHEAENADDAMLSIVENIKNSVRYSRQGGVTIGESISTLMVEMDTPSHVMPTGIPTLDRLGAGYRPGEVTVLAGRPSSGKSAFALQSAKAVARAGYPVWVASLEMTHTSLSMRWLSNDAQVDFGRLRTNTLSDVEMNRIAGSQETLSALPITIDDRSGLSLGDLRRQMSGQEGGLLVVDYLQLLKPPDFARAYRSRVAEVGALSRGLKAIATDCKCSVLALSQLNRGVETRGGLPHLSDLRDSGEIEQDADIVTMIHRVADDDLPNRSVLAVRKFRNGPLAEIDLVFDGETQRFRERSEADPTPTKESKLADKVRSW
jgi:replicative DNA helicase